MELPGSGYLYTLAVLAMTFVGFCAIVLAFRHTTKTSQTNVLHSHIYIELGFSAASFAMLPPLLATFGLSAPVIWRSSSLIIAVILVVQTCFFVVRVLRVTERLYLRMWVNWGITIILAVILVVNAAGSLFEPQLGPIALAATWRLVHGAEVFMLTFEGFFANLKSAKRN